MTLALTTNPYAGYTYGYPHKTAYRRLDPPVDLAELWAGEDRAHLFGYLHLPFCEMRCGFCNLFTTANPRDDLVDHYLDALDREALATAEIIQPATSARYAIGGGTPTYLPPAQLARLLDVFPRVFGRPVADVPTSIETSPATATPDRIALLADTGVRRISIGIQSMDPAEVHRIGRRQRDDEVRTALDTLRTLGPPILNIDLMYGLPDQTPDTWLTTLRDALQWQPEEVFAYPLYVRPLTGLDHVATAPTDLRPELYRLGRDLLLAEGYEQTSMRRFRRRGIEEVDDEYACQSDGMVGLGCGARSYTHELHYSREYAVGRRGVKAIIEDYMNLTDAELRVARHGFRLDADERMRRFALQSLLHVDGLDVEACRVATGADPEALPLDQLIADGLATRTAGRVRLTPEGLALSDAIGPLLYSDGVKDLSRDHDLR